MPDDALCLISPHDRELIADHLEDIAAVLRGEPFRSGAVDLGYIQGIEHAADIVRSGQIGTGPVDA